MDGLNITKEKAGIAVAVVLVVILIIIVYWSVFKKSEHLVSFRDFPGQKMATAEMLARATSGFNEPSQTGAQDPYAKAMLDLSSIENAWTTANWKYTG